MAGEAEVQERVMGEEKVHGIVEFGVQEGYQDDGSIAEEHHEITEQDDPKEQQL